MTQLTLSKPEFPSPEATAEAHPRRRHHGRRWLVVAIVVVVALVAGVAGFRMWLKQAPDKVTVDQAVDRYRSTSSPTTPAALGAPSPGVYVFVTSGTETVDALGGDTHTYPAETTITVTSTDCGFRMSWIPLDGRSDATDVCRTGGGFAVTSAINSHEFFHMSQDEHFTWEPGSWWLPPEGVTRWTATGRSDGGRTTARVAQVIGTEDISVGSTTTPARHVRFDDTVTGSSTGTSSTDLWLDLSTGLPLRETSNASTANDTIIGHVTFSEAIILELVSTTPRT